MANYDLTKKDNNEVALIDEKKTEIDLKQNEKEIISNIINAETKDELQKQFDLFNLTQSKKNAVRITKITDLMSDVEDEIYRRFHKRPDQISNKELLEFLQVLSSQVDRSQRNVDSLENKDLIKKMADGVSKPNTDVTINLGTNLDKDTKDNAMLAVKEILGMIQNSGSIENIVPVEETKDNTEFTIIEEDDFTDKSDSE